MNFDRILYPAPTPPSYNNEKLFGHLIFIPRYFHPAYQNELKCPINGFRT